MNTQPTIRERIVSKFKAALGEPEEAKVSSGWMYRWTLNRMGNNETPMYVTIASPELLEMAHVFVSDSRKYQVEPVLSLTVSTMEEGQLVLDRIMSQWKSNSDPSTGPYPPDYGK